MPKRLTILVALLALAASLAATPASGASAAGGVVDLPYGPGGPVPEDYAFNSAVVARSLADTWHKAGHRGAGTTVAILGTFDARIWDAAARIHELPARSGVSTFCQLSGSTSCGNFITGGSYIRSTAALAELVHDMAPAADLAVVRVVTADDLSDAVDWMVTEGVDVLLRPYTGVIDGPGDGTGPTDAALDEAVTAGITVVQSVSELGSVAPEDPGPYLRVTGADADDDGWLELTPDGDERIPVETCGSGITVRWDDFGQGDDASDYAPVMMNGDSEVNGGYADQSATVPPIEQFTACSPSYELAVKVVDEGMAEAEDDVIEFFGAGGTTFGESTVDGSAATAGEDSTNPGVVTVGALEPPSATPAPFSSRGPAGPDPATPDLAGLTCLATYSLRAGCASGTGPPAAVVAGAAALHRADEPADTPADVAAWLTTNTVDRGVAGVDNATGHGELLLPSMGPHPRYKPDAQVRPPGSALVGDNRYNATGVRQVGTGSARPGRDVVFQVRLQNDGDTPERFLVGGSRTAFNFRITYVSGGRDITRQVIDGLWSTPVVQPTQSATLQVKVRVPYRPTVGGIRGVVQALSQTNLTTVDAIRFIAAVRA